MTDQKNNNTSLIQGIEQFASEALKPLPAFLNDYTFTKAEDIAKQMGDSLGAIAAKRIGLGFTGIAAVVDVLSADSNQDKINAAVSDVIGLGVSMAYGPSAGAAAAYAANKGLSFRVRPESSSVIADFSDHEADGRQLEECQSIVGSVLEIFCETAATIEPSDGALDDPALWQQFEPFGFIGSLDDFDIDLGQSSSHSLSELRSLIATVSVELAQKRIETEQR